MMFSPVFLYSLTCPSQIFFFFLMLHLALAFKNPAVSFKHTPISKNGKRNKKQILMTKCTTLSSVIIRNLVKSCAFGSKHRHMHICRWTDPPILQNEVQMWSNQLPWLGCQSFWCQIKQQTLRSTPMSLLHLCWPGKPRMSLPELCSGAFCFPLSSSTIVQCQLILHSLSFSFLSLRYDHVLQITVNVLSSSVLPPFHNRLKGLMR